MDDEYGFGGSMGVREPCAEDLPNFIEADRDDEYAIAVVFWNPPELP